MRRRRPHGNTARRGGRNFFGSICRERNLRNRIRKRVLRREIQGSCGQSDGAGRSSGIFLRAVQRKLFYGRNGGDSRLQNCFRRKNRRRESDGSLSRRIGVYGKRNYAAADGYIFRGLRSGNRRENLLENIYVFGNSRRKRRV